MSAEFSLHPGARVRKRTTKQTGSVYQLVADDRAMVKWDGGQFCRERADQLVVASAVDELAAIELGGKPVSRECDPQVLRALRGELHQHRGGHQPVVQADVGKLSTTAARCLYDNLRSLRNRLQRARTEPWRRI